MPEALSPSQPRRLPLGPLRLSLLILGLAVFFGALEAWQGRFLFPTIPFHQFWPEAIFRAMPSWIILAALMPGVIGLTRALRFEGRFLWLGVLVQALGGVVFVALHLGGTAWVATLRPDGDMGIADHLLRLLYRYAVNDFFVYCAIVGVLRMIWHQSDLRAREVAESELRARLAEARLGALRAQLNPHFLFNTLNAMTTLALRGERERLVGAIDALCTLMRAALDDRHGSWSSLAEELQFVDRYFEIQALRFGERLHVERQVPEETHRALVPTLMLQPLVENAIEHGIARRAGPGRIVIRASREDLMLRIEVSDTGPGFATEPRATAADDHSGVGLSNTRARLDQLFGSRSSLECVNAPEGGAMVTVRLPWIESRPEAGTPRAGIGR